MPQIFFWQTNDRNVTNEDQNTDIFASILQWSWNVLEMSEVYVTNVDLHARPEYSCGNQNMSRNVQERQIYDAQDPPSRPQLVHKIPYFM